MSNYPLKDTKGRKARYLRLSVTDRCNLECRYCVSRERQRFIPHERILRYEEFYRLVAICQAMGVGKVRITGGEPFARKGIRDFLRGMRSRFPDLRLAITTNATLIDACLPDLASLNLSSINISLDSFDRATTRKICGHDALPRVLANIDRLLALGQRVKINAVAMAGITDAQMADFIHAAKTMPIDIRFIEYMPMGVNTLWDAASFLSCASLQALAQSLCQLTPAIQNDELAGPARMFALKNGKGRLGFISAISDHFCAACNRMRLTSEGNLRTCLFADSEIRLAGMLRNPAISDSHIAHAIAACLRKKPLGSDILAARSRAAVASRQMVGIGG